jgi:hypothetical protein
MTIKWDRESVLVILMALAILFGVFYYGYTYFVKPVKEEADLVTERIATQQSLVATYQPSEEKLAEFQTFSEETEEFLPVGDATNNALIILDRHASEVNVNIQSVSREVFQEAIEELPEGFVTNTYSIEMTSDAPGNFRRLIDRLMNEMRIWNIHSFTYSKAGEASYTGNLLVELPYYSTAILSETETTEDE